MSISKDLFLAILSMDSYNRGYEAGIADGEGPKDTNGNDIDGLGESGRIGGATILPRPNNVDYQAWQATGFYAIAYDITDTSQIDGWTGESTVIAYRGTDKAIDYTQGWTVGGGFVGWNQSKQALDFYHAVTKLPYRQSSTDTVLTGHSLGGGLAGFVSALTGTAGIGFDNMTYSVAALVQASKRRVGANPPFPQIRGLDLGRDQLADRRDRAGPEDDRIRDRQLSAGRKRG